MERCEQCGFGWDEVAAAELPDRFDRAVSRVRALVSCGGDLAGRPEPERWSGLEYSAHLRDVALNLRDRIIAGLAVELPDPGSMYPVQRVDAGVYAQETPDQLDAELAVAAALFSRLLAAIDRDEQNWQRELIYPWPRRAPRSLRWVAAQVVHEWEHHGADIAANLAVGRAPLFHFAVRDEWARMEDQPELTVSTRGRTLEQEGFIHLCTRAQLDGVAQRFYGDVLDDLVVLELDPAGFPDGALRFDVVGDGAFPHLHAPLPRSAVSAVRDYARLGR